MVHRKAILFVGLVMTVSLFSCSGKQQRDETIHVIAFMDFDVNQKIPLNDSKNANLLNQFAEIADSLYPKNYEKFRSFQVQLYPLFFNTSAGIPIFAESLNKEEMRDLPTDISTGYRNFKSKLTRDYLTFNKQYSEGNIDIKCKIMESAGVIADKLSNMNHEPVMIIFYSDFVEVGCELGDTEDGKCFNFYDKTGGYNQYQVNKASASLDSASTELFKTVKEYRSKMPSDLSNVTLYFVNNKHCNVKTTGSMNFNVLMNFWFKYFKACGFSEKNMYKQ